MSASAGSFFSAYRLDLSGLTQDIASAKQQLTDLRAFAARPTTIGAGGGAAGAVPAAGAGQAAALGALQGPQQQTADGALRLASAEARLAVAMGEPARAASILSTALTQNVGASNQSTLAIQTQAARLATGKTAFQQYGDAAKSAFLGIIGPAAVVAGALKLVGEAQELIALGNRADAARVSFDHLAVSVHTTGDALLTGLRAAAQGTVSDADLISSANSGILLTGGKLATELPRLLQIARASAQATGDEVGFVFDSLVKGIARGSPQIIDNAKITLDAEGAFKAYAASIGKTSDQLTRADQQQATLNAVLLAGTDIINKTGGATESNTVRAQRLAANWDNLKARFGSFLSEAVAPTITGLNAIVTGLDAVSAAQGVAQGRLTAESGAILKAATSYDVYAAAIKRANDARNQSISPGQRAEGNDIPALTAAEYAYAQSLIATGVAADVATERARNMVTELVAGGVAAAASAVGHAQAAAAATQLGAAMDTERTAVANATATRLADLSAMDAERQAAALNTDAVIALRNANVVNTAALVDQIATEQTSQIAGQQLAQVQNTLAQLGAAVAGGFQTAGAAAIQLSRQYGIATDQALLLINAQAQLAHAAVAARALDAQRTEERGALPSDELASRTRANEAAERLHQQFLSSQRRGGGGGGAGGGAGAKLSDQQRLNTTLLADQNKADDKMADLDRDHYRNLLKIQADFEKKSLDQQRQNEVSKRQGRADFYDNLTSSSKELGQKESQALAAEYEGAYAKAQGIAQAGNQKLADDYLAMRQQQIQKEIEYQKARAKAAQDGDKGEVARLDAIRKLQVEADAEKEKQLLAGGDPNVKARQEAEAQEGARYDEAAGKIVTAADRAAQAKIAGAVASGKAIDTENLKLKEQADYYDRIRARTGVPSADLPPPSTGASAAPPEASQGASPAGGGGDQVWRVFDSAVVDALNAQTAQLSADLAGVTAAVVDVGRRVSSVETAVRGLSGRVMS